MKIDLESIDKTQFMVHEHIVNGEVLYLVQPQHIGCKWTQANKHFRSSVWNAQGELVSAGFPKFTNWGENPENFPLPETLKGATTVEKLDGSLLIVSKYKGNLIIRTRGTVDATKLDNGHEIELFKQMFKPHHDCWDVRYDTWDFSQLFEWVSPANKIVLDYGDKPDWYYVGYVDHIDYALCSQKFLDDEATHWGWKRPITYTFGTVAELLDGTKSWVGKEGVCVYSNDGQTIHKVKSDWYLVRHAMKSELNSIEKVLDFWLQNGKPDYEQFKAEILRFDYEIWERVQGFASRISDAWKEVQKIEAGMINFIETQLKPLPLRKLQAVTTIQSYGKTERTNCVFSLLDGKPLNNKQYEKLMYQVLKR